MGFAKYAEDISDRYYEEYFNAPSPSALQDKFRWAVQMVDDLAFAFNKKNANDSSKDRSHWEDHLGVIDTIYDVLNGISDLSDDKTKRWEQILLIEQNLSKICVKYEKYGPLSPSIYVRFSDDAREIFRKIKDTTDPLDFLQNYIPQDSEEVSIRTKTLDRIESFREKLDADLRKINNSENKRVTSSKLWKKYIDIFRIALVDKNHRTPLQSLDRFRLNEDQEQEVAKNYEGIRRIQGASGCGKTIILIHRALRLAHENPKHTIRIFTINRSLAKHLVSIMRTIHGEVPSNIQIDAFYDFMIDCVSLFENKDSYRLADDRSKERIAGTWQDFYRHSSQNPENNVFARTDVKKLIGHIEHWGGQAINASCYLRDEMIYIQSAFSKNERELYLEIERSSRSIGLNKTQERPLCLKILEAWEEWLETGDLCDIDGITLQMAKYLDSPNSRDKMREHFRADHILLDEFQDFSTLEMTILKNLFGGSNEEKRENIFFMVGDINQKVFSKHHDRSLVGFNFSNRSKTMKRNYRNTRQILQAAYQVPLAFPPKTDDDVDISDPELSSFNGSQPIILHCENTNHASTVYKILEHRGKQRVAIVSENEFLLKQIKEMANQNGIPYYELFRNNDLDYWKNQQTDSFSSCITISHLEAIKGFEFDTVIVADLSHDVLPVAGTPHEEKWRDAAIVYAALTRARDELIITYTGHPSEFVNAMKDHVIFQPESNISFMEKLFNRVLEAI